MDPLISLLACAATICPAGAPGAAAGDERELVVMVEEDFLESWPVLVELAHDFERAHAGVSVRLLPLSGAVTSQHKGKFMLAGDLPLDVLRIDVTEMAAFLGEGALVDLQPFLDADPSFDARSYFPQVLDAMRDPRGHLHGLASTFTPYVMYVNLDLLERNGLARPAPDWTWEDFLALARACTKDADGDGRTDEFGVSLTQWLQAVSPWIFQNGATLLDGSGERAGMADPRFVEALGFLRGLLHEEKVASFDASFANQLSQGLFQAGRCAFYGPVGYWETFRFKHIRDFRWDVVPLPRARESATAVAMTVYVIPRTARYPDLAYEFLRVLASERYQQTLAQIGNGVPGLIAAARSPAFLKPDVAPESEQVFLDAMATARFMPPLANWQKIESICQSELEGILLLEDCDVQAACERMARETDAFLARERARRALPELPRGTLELAVGVSVIALVALFLLRRGARPPPVLAREERHAYGLIGLWAAGFLLFLFGPAVVSLVLAFSEWSPLRTLDSARFTGVDNFARLAGDGTFRASLRATFLYAGLSVPLSLGLALALALCLRRTSTLAASVRTIVYLPAVIAPVIVGALWRFVLDAENGLANRALRGLGIEGPAWLRDPDWVVPSFVLMSLWSVGAQMIVFLAALQSLDPTLEEAARIDGAGRARRLWHVILPALAPVVLFNLITGTIAAFQVFAQPYVTTEGGPGDASRFLVLYLYETAFRHLDMGYASALGWVIFALLAVLTGVLLAGSRRFVHHSSRSMG